MNYLNTIIQLLQIDELLLKGKTNGRKATNRSRNKGQC